MANTPPVAAKQVPPLQAKSLAQNPVTTPKAVPPSNSTPPPGPGLQSKPPIDNVTNQKPGVPTLVPKGVPPAKPKPVTPPMNAAAQAAAAQAGAVKAKEEKAGKKIAQAVGKKTDSGMLNIDDTQLIQDMRETIQDQTEEVARKVNRSAFKYVYKKTDWIKEEAAPDAEKFFTVNVPKVLSEELSNILNDALGISDDKNS